MKSAQLKFSNSGFTLLELLVVITITTIIAVVAFVNFQNLNQDQAVNDASSQTQNFLREAESDGGSNQQCKDSSGVDHTALAWHVDFISSHSFRISCDYINPVGGATTPAVQKTYAIDPHIALEVRDSSGLSPDCNLTVSINFALLSGSVSHVDESEKVAGVSATKLAQAQPPVTFTFQSIAGCNSNTKTLILLLTDSRSGSSSEIVIDKGGSVYATPTP